MWFQAEGNSDGQVLCLMKIVGTSEKPQILGLSSVSCCCLFSSLANKENHHETRVMRKKSSTKEEVPFVMFIWRKHTQENIVTGLHTSSDSDKDNIEAALLLGHSASAGKGTSPLIDLLTLAGPVAAASLLLRLPHGVPDGLAAAMLAVHLLQLLAALLKVLLLRVVGGFLLLFLTVEWGATLSQEALAWAERAPLHLLAALLPVLAALFVDGGGGDGGGVGGGCGEGHQRCEESCCECYLDRHSDET